MTKQQEMQRMYCRNWINKKIENKECTSCGLPLDREGKICSKCLDKHRVRTNEIRTMRKSLGLCPRCGKRKLWGDEKNCIECSTNAVETTMRNRDKEHYNEIHREWERKKNAELRSKGICPRCKKRKADYGYKTCSICRDKNRKDYSAKRSKPNRSKIRYEKGLCYFCDNPVEQGYRVCNYHHELNIQYANSEKSKAARKKVASNWY